MSGHPHGCHKRTDQRVARHDPQRQMQLTNPTTPKERPFQSMHWLPDHYGSYIKTDGRQTGFWGISYSLQEMEEADPTLLVQQSSTRKRGWKLVESCSYPLQQGQVSQVLAATMPPFQRLQKCTPQNIY